MVTIAYFQSKNYYEVIFRSLLPLAILVAFATTYLGAFYRYGFDWGDMGSYALISYELYLGSNPAEFLSYGPLWYFLGETVFRVWGVDFVALLVMIQVILVLSALLLFFGVRSASGRTWAAFVAALLFILVPPFFASAIRSISLGLFLLPYILLAQAGPRRDLGPLMLTAAAIGLNFQLRPDFGYIYLGMLLVLLAARSRYYGQSVQERVSTFVRSVLISLAIMAIVSAPLMVHAVLNGYLQPLLTDLSSYPLRLLSIALNAGGLAGIVAASDGHEATFLHILPFAALWGPNWGNRVFAFLIYSTLLVLAASSVQFLIRFIRRTGGARDNLSRLAVLLVAGSQWPAFGMFRPEWIHFVSFMHAYLILAACMGVWLVGAHWPRETLKRVVRAGVLLVLAVQMALFVCYGEQVDGIGWWAKRAGRNVVFESGNGVRVIVSAGEKLYLETIDHIIRANSQPGEDIICVPYCAGFAFMTGRRSFFKEHYVDDGTPRWFPGWINKAIAATAAARVPVIIVLDWATNDTEASRFEVWAARFMDFVRKTYPVSVPFGPNTVWLLHPVDATRTRIETVVAYGPSGTAVGMPFNVQPDGRSALWMRVSGEFGLSAVIRFDDRPLQTFVSDKLLTALVPSEVLASPGRHWLRIVDPGYNAVTKPVSFDVTLP